MPKIRNQWKLRADRRTWSTTYWPYADLSGTGRGRKRQNLWADGGCLDKYDGLMAKRGGTSEAKAFEKTPALNWLRDEDATCGYFVPSTTISESDAERTTGVDLTATGTLDADVTHDFLDEFGNFGSSGTTDGRLDVSWWGSCDQVALAGQLFERPRKSVTVEGITFTPQDIKGLLTIIADCQGGDTEFVGKRYEGAPDQVRMKSGAVLEGKIQGLQLRDFRTGAFRRRDNFVVRSDVNEAVKLKKANGEVVTIPATRIQDISREDIESLRPSLFHKTVKAWLRQKRPFAMDHDRGPHVWNDSYDGADIKKTRKVPGDVDPSTLNGANGPYGGGDLCFYTTELLKGSTVDKRYRYWVEKSGGEDVNSGWVDAPGFNENPDFLWRPTATPTWKGPNPRNPHVLPSMVKELYEASIS